MESSTDTDLLTVMVQVAVLLPSSVVTVMIAVPSFTALTNPVLSSYFGFTA